MKKIRIFLFFVTTLFGFFYLINIFSGAPTLKTIIINGNMQDWSEVLTNPNNVTLDGVSASNCANSTDRDCPVQSTGRDMVKFAWTYDSNNIYLYVERVGSSSNIQNFFFIMDVGQDKLANSTDFVLHVSYQGSNRLTNLTLYRYLPLNPSGDPLVDANGFADGYRMLGSLVAIPSNDPSYFVVSGITGGSITGEAFETYLPWNKILVSSGTPIFFHVASGNNASLSQVDDNLGGPGGRIGAFAYYWVQIYPDHLSSVNTGNNISYSHTVKNNGSFDDTIDLYATSSNGLPLSILLGGTLIAKDSNGDGDFVDAEDYLNASYDSNSNGRPDLQLSEWSTQNIDVQIETSLLPSNSYDLTTIYAVSSGDGSYSFCKDETYIGDLLLIPDINTNGTPSGYVYLEHTLINERMDDYIKLGVNSLSEFSIYLYLGVELLGIDNEGDGIWNYVNPSYDSNSDGFPDIFLSQGSSIGLILYVTIPSSAVIGTFDSITFSANAHTNGGSSSAFDIINIKPSFSFVPSYSFTTSTEKYGAPNHSTYFSHKLTNNSTTPKRFTFYATGFEPSNDSSWTITIYSDPNGDGNPSDGSVISYTDYIPAQGGEFNIVVEIAVPSSVLPPAVSNSSVTAVKCLSADCSSYDTNVKETVEDDIKVSYIVPFSDNLFTISESHFAPCKKLYSKAFNVVPDQVGRYRVKLLDPSSNTVRDVAKNSDSGGSFTDEYLFPANSPSGNYKLQLIDNSSILDEANIFIERNGSEQVQVSKMGRELTDSLTFEYLLSNNNSYVDFRQSKVFLVVTDPTNSLYLKEDGTWGATASGVYSKMVNGIDVNAGENIQSSTGFATVTFPSYGQYTLCSSWEFECGFFSEPLDNISNSCTNFYVVSMESYSDSERTSLKEQFVTSDYIYFSGEGYLPSTAYIVAIYNSSGSRVSYSTKLSESDGKLLYDIAPSTLSEGNYTLAVFPSGITPPLTYISNYQYELSLDDFSVYQIVLLRYGGVTSLNPHTPPKSDVFVNYPQDPSLSFQRDAESYGFLSGSSFNHEVTDLSPSSPPIVYYQLYGNTGDTLRVLKDGAKITITY